MNATKISKQVSTQEFPSHANMKAWLIKTNSTQVYHNIVKQSWTKAQPGQTKLHKSMSNKV